MKIDYSTYSLEELLQASECIDKQRYPERFQLLKAEIRKRLAAKEDKKIVQQQSQWEQTLHMMDEEEDNRWYIEFDNDSPKLFRFGFLALYFTAIALLLPKTFLQPSIPQYNDLPRYQIYIKSARCKTQNYRDDGHTYSYSEFLIQGYGIRFYAPDIHRSACKRLEKQLSPGTDVQIWHDQGAIFQLQLQEDILLSNDYMRSIYQRYQSQESRDYFIFLLVVIFAGAASAINAIRPGTFSRSY